MAKEPRVGVVAILKQEAPYLLEWIAHYRVLGVRRFFLADNGGQDGTSDLLTRLDRAGIINRFPWPTALDGAPQLPAYEYILSGPAQAVDWVAIVDGDEFIRLEPPFRALSDLVAGIAGDAGAIALNWAIYGSSGLATNDGRFVTERFTMRGEKDFKANRHVKIIVRPELVVRMHNPHFAELLPGHAAADSNGAPVVMPYPGISAAAIWGAARVDHYVVKSLAECDAKRARGLADSKGKRGASFFADHDRNDVLDPMPSEMVEATRQEVVRLQNLI